MTGSWYGCCPLIETGELSVPYQKPCGRSPDRIPGVAAGLAARARAAKPLPAAAPAVAPPSRIAAPATTTHPASNRYPRARRRESSMAHQPPGSVVPHFRTLENLVWLGPAWMSCRLGGRRVRGN